VIRVRAGQGRHTVFISVGSNLGDKLANCRAGVERLCADGAVRLTGRSADYRTAPVDFTDQDWFVNSVVRVETALSPEELLDRMQAVQRAAGRAADAVRFGPRVLDLDILLYDELVCDGPRVVIPHPRMAGRRFVLKPMCDIDPAVRHPVTGKSAAQMLAELREAGQEVVELA
jgi:2-amino-4-hydroxy-6-hydroxymethyldihydropteridine diphosphokinase